MSIKDYNKKFFIINGTTNEKIAIPNIERDTIVLKDFKLSDILLFDTILQELHDTDSVTIFRTYMKD